MRKCVALRLERRGILAVTSLPSDSSKETSGQTLKSIARKLAPWYGGIVGVYAAIHTVYSWFGGVLKVPFVYLIFNICSMVGLVTLLALFPGALFAAFGLLVGDFLSDDSRVSKRTAWLFGMLAAAGSGLYFLFLLSSDARDFTVTPTFDAINCFGVALGGTILVTTYVVLGKRLIGLLKDLKKD